MFTDAEGKFHHGTLFNHDTIIRHFVMALSSLGPESWGDTFTLGGSQDYPEIPEMGCDAVPSQTPSSRVGKQASNLLAPPPLLSIVSPFPTFGRHITCSDSGVYLGHDVRFLGRNQSGDLHESLACDAEHVMVPLPKSLKRTEKCAGQPPLPLPPVPLHSSLLAPGRCGAWSNSRLPLMWPHDSDSDEYVPSHYRKRARLSIQGPPQSGPSTYSPLPNNRVQDDIPPWRSLCKKSTPKV